MTPKQLAAQLNGREYGKEITKEEEKLARENNLVVVFGYSDDLCELRGAITDEVGCYDGGEFLINKNGVLDINDEDSKVLEKYNLTGHVTKGSRKIEILWGKDDYSFTYKTDIPHETFDILEDGSKYCRGIVFSLDSI